MSPDLIWTGDLTPGQTATITYTVTVSNPDTGDKHLINMVTSDDPGSTCPTGTTNPACSTTVIDLIPTLTITKTANVSTVTPGSAVGYTISIVNTGQTPYTAANITDSLAGVLGDAAYNHDATASTGTVSYASPVLTWTGDLAVGATATIPLLSHGEQSLRRWPVPVQHRRLGDAGRHLPSPEAPAPAARSPSPSSAESCP